MSTIHSKKITVIMEVFVYIVLLEFVQCYILYYQCNMQIMLIKNIYTVYVHITISE